jgi:DNA polymerase-3 subunit delta
MTSAQSSIANVYAVFGADAFRKRETIAELCTRIAAESGDGQGPIMFDGSDAELAEVLDEVRTFSLLGGRRIVVVSGADPFVSRHRAALERYCEAPADSGTLILECNSLPGNTRLHKIIAKQGVVIKHDALKGRAITDWIVERSREAYGKRMDAQAAWLLRELCGSTLGLLDAELSKLATYVGDREGIAKSDIEALVGRHREEDVFGVLDALADKDARRALEKWERVLETDRAAPGRAIGGLAWGIRRLIDLKQQAERGVSPHALARQAYTRPEILERRLRIANVVALQGQMRDLLEADLASKTGLSSVPVAIERFIIKHCGRN